MVWQWGSFNQAMYKAVDNAVKGEIGDTLRTKAREQTDTNRREALDDLANQTHTNGIVLLETAIGVRSMAPAPVPATTP